MTFDIPPLNIFGPKQIPQLNEIITAIETDQDMKVGARFDSAVDGFFLTQLRLGRRSRIPHASPGTYRLQALFAGHAGASAAALCRLHRFNPGQSRTGVGSELGRSASDMRSAA